MQLVFLLKLQLRWHLNIPIFRRLDKAERRGWDEMIAGILHAMIFYLQMITI